MLFYKVEFIFFAVSASCVDDGQKDTSRGAGERRGEEALSQQALRKMPSHDLHESCKSSSLIEIVSVHASVWGRKVSFRVELLYEREKGHKVT